MDDLPCAVGIGVDGVSGESQGLKGGHSQAVHHGWLPCAFSVGVDGVSEDSQDLKGRNSHTVHHG